jgi:hypothetical protein
MIPPIEGQRDPDRPPLPRRADRGTPLVTTRAVVVACGGVGPGGSGTSPVRQSVLGEAGLRRWERSLESCRAHHLTSDSRPRDSQNGCSAACVVVRLCPGWLQPLPAVSCPLPGTNDGQLGQFPGEHRPSGPLPNSVRVTVEQGGQLRRAGNEGAPPPPGHLGWRLGGWFVVLVPVWRPLCGEAGWGWGG